MASVLDTSNSQLSADQASLASLQAQLSSATNDSNIASLRQKIALIQAHYGQSDPNGKDGYHYWVDGSGNFWSGKDADSEWNSAQSQVTANTNLINNLNNQIANYTNNVIPADEAVIAKLNAADPTLKAQAAAITATAAAKVNSSKTILWIVAGVVIIGLILTFYFIKRKKNKSNV